MATEDMGEVDDIHSKDEGETILNGDVSMEDDDSQSSVNKKSSINSDTDQMEVDEETNQDDEDDDNNEAQSEVNSINTEDNNETEQEEKDDDDDDKVSDEGEDTVDSVITQKDDKQKEQEEKIDDGDDDDEKSQGSTDNKDDDDDDNDGVDDIDNNDEVSTDNKNNDKENKEIKDNKKIDEDNDNNKEKIEQNGKHDEIHEILDDDDDDDDNNDNEENKVIELDDSGGDDDEEGDDVLIIEPKENGTLEKPQEQQQQQQQNINKKDEFEVIELDNDTTTINKKKKAQQILPTRRSTRNINKTKSYIESDKEDDSPLPRSSEESDVEEIVPQDPLAVNDHLEIRKTTQKSNSTISSSSSSSTTSASSTIVVKDTKRLVEIAAKSNNNSGNKKEPTLVIIDTNSILSGRGPVPVNSNNNKSNNNNNYPTILPTALPAQGMYPANMRATITPIPFNNSNTTLSKGSVTISAAPPSSSFPSSSAASSSSATVAASQATVLPTLTDDMFVVEAPSFIVPYVYEKPPVKDFKEFVQEIKKEILKMDKEKQEKQKQQDEKDKDENNKNKDDVVDDKKLIKDDIVDDDEPMEIDDKNSTSSKEDLCMDDDKKPYDYFSSPLGKFFSDIGFNLVQEFVQSDLLRQQKRKRDREGGHNPTTNKTIHSLIKDLEFSKENNEPFKIPMKKCEFCNFKTESALALSHHLETPHMKNYVYKCNFCSYEIRSPHDILFHMEAEHAIRGRLERAPAFHQCPNCPFEDNQKGKLSRHLVACMRKFKPEKNLEPPIDWEPPAKIPRVPKQRPGLNVSAYQAMKNTQLQFLSKMQLLNASGQSTAAAASMQINRGRGRPALNASTTMKGQTIMRPSGMVYKQQNLTGGSVLVPTNYQLSGNQLYQNQSKNKSVHQPSISITPLPRQSSSASSPSSNSTSLSSSTASKPGDINSKNSFVICEICDGYIKDLEQLRNHMQWIHKVKIHPKMIYNRPPLNCQKCQFRFFTDQGLERHLLGSHGLVTSSMQDAANKSKDAGRCPVCGRVYQWKLLSHVARDHNMTLKPAHLSYKCTVCTATFGMYKQFENHVYSAHSVVAKRVMDKKNSSGSSGNPSSSSSSSSNNNSGGGGGTNNNKSDQSQLMKPLKINDEITIIPQPAKPINNSGSTPSTSKNADITTSSSSSTSSSFSSSSSAQNNNDGGEAPSSANGAI